MATADAVKHNVYALTREAPDFFYEVLILVIDREAAQVGDGWRTSR